MPIVVPQTLRGPVERSGRRLGRRRKRRVSPIISKEDVAPTPEATGVRAVKIESKRGGGTATTVRYVYLGDDTLSWRKPKDTEPSRSLPIKSVTGIDLVCPAAFEHAAPDPGATLCLSAHVGSGRGRRLRRFYFALDEPREARTLIMDLQEKSFGRDQVPISRGRLLWHTVRLRAQKRAKQADRPVRAIVNDLWCVALQSCGGRECTHAGGSTTAERSSERAALDDRTKRELMFQNLELSPLGAFFPGKQRANKGRPSINSSTGLLGQVVCPHRQSRRQHRHSAPVLQPSTASSSSRRRNSVSDVVAVTVQQRPRTADGFPNANARRLAAGSAGQQRPRTADEPVSGHARRSATGSAGQQRPRTADRIASGNAWRSASPQKHPQSGGVRPLTVEVGGLLYFTPEEAAWLNDRTNTVAPPNTAGATKPGTSSCRDGSSSDPDARSSLASLKRPRTAFRRRPLSAAACANMM